MIEWLSDIVGSFHWLRPWALAGIALALIVHRLGRRNEQDQHVSWYGIIDKHLAPHLIISGDSARLFRPIDMLTLVVVFTSVALAGPSWQREPMPLVDDQAPLIIALDLSSAMNAVDTTPTRLERAKFKISRLLERRGKAPTGLVVYAGTAHLVLPPSVDSFVLNSYLDALSTSLMPLPGQRPGLALDLAREWLDRSPTLGTVLFMTADAPADELQAFIQHRRNSPHVVALLALGTQEGGLVRVHSGDYQIATQGLPTHARRDDEGLHLLKDKAGVMVVSTTADERDLDALEGMIAVARVQAAEDDPRARWRDEGLWLVWPALLLMLVLFRRGWSVRWDAVSIVMAGSLALVLISHSETALATESSDDFVGLWLTADQQGRWLFENQRPAEAAARFANPLWRGAALAEAGDFASAAEVFTRVDSAAGWFNRAQMLARQLKFQDAVEAYDEAIRRAPGWTDAIADRERIATLAALVAAAQAAADEQDQAISDDDAPDGFESTDQQQEGGAKKRLPLSEVQLAEHWLKRIDTSPADFLRRKFEIQAQSRDAVEVTR